MDTIVAPATVTGRSALAIVRIDGPGSASILEALCGLQTAVRTATLIHLRRSAAEPPIDECVAVRFEAPSSFTGNDLVELTLHGSPVIVEQVISACRDLGARMAEPGEFTERAVLNGKLDLVQAESIADLINARTALQARLSLSNVEGHLSRVASGVRQALLDLISRSEAGLDFSEEGYDFISSEERSHALREVRESLTRLEESYRRGRASREGLVAAIVGRPNAGKSTLLNRLIGTDRAIVTAIPGTTRDVVRETIEIGGLPVTFSDTAGLRRTEDVVEGIGIERARNEAARADLVLYLVDACEGLTDQDREEIDRFDVAPDRSLIVIYTKVDLVAPPEDGFGISVLSGQGIDALLEMLDRIVRDHYLAAEGSLVNERQRAAVADCRDAVEAALESEHSHADAQLVLVDLYRASNAIGLLTGAITRDEILAEIFGRFCIGK